MRITLVLAAGSLTVAAPTYAVSRQTWVDISDVGAAGLTGFALINPIVVGDSPGFWQASGSVLIGGLGTEGLKQLVKERRPDGSDNRSFPSTHAGVAFGAATTLWRRDGWKVGLPALAVASLTGFARVQARKHFWYDVVAGGAIGVAGGFALTKPLNSGARLFPWGDTHRGGVTFTKQF